MHVLIVLLMVMAPQCVREPQCVQVYTSSTCSPCVTYTSVKPFLQIKHRGPPGRRIQVVRLGTSKEVT